MHWSTGCYRCYNTSLYECIGPQTVLGVATPACTSALVHRLFYVVQHQLVRVHWSTDCSKCCNTSFYECIGPQTVLNVATPAYTNECIGPQTVLGVATPAYTNECIGPQTVLGVATPGYTSALVHKLFYLLQHQLARVHWSTDCSKCCNTSCTNALVHRLF